MKIKVLSCLIAVLFLLCSCGTGSATVEDEGIPAFPEAPDKIIVGVDGGEKELAFGEEAFEKIMSGIKKRADTSTSYGALLLAAHDPETGKHISNYLRTEEVFVEFVYNEVTVQSFLMGQTGGESAPENKDVIRIFFPLTGEYHNDFFVSEDPDYNQSASLGFLSDNSDLITYVRGLFSE